eukprot:scaffold5543_cov20-Tisochrysis_lutea.AAC.3
MWQVYKDLANPRCMPAHPAPFSCAATLAWEIGTGPEGVSTVAPCVFLLCCYCNSASASPHYALHPALASQHTAWSLEKGALA